MNDYELIIINRGNIYFPSIIEPVNWEDEIKGNPSKLTFTVVKGDKSNFQEGNIVRFKYKGNEIFFGYVFTKKRDKQHHIEVTAYDQMRYLKNKDTLVFENKSPSDILKQVADINQISLGSVDNIDYKLESFIQEDKSYMDMIYNSLDIVLTEQMKMYILYDDFGNLALRDIEDLIIDDFILTDANMENFDYSSSIDEETYNQINLAFDNEETGKRERYIAKDSGNIDRWGLLQYFESIDDSVNGELKADTLLELYNRKTRKLKLKGIEGNVKARAGFRIMIFLNLGDIILQNYLIIQSSKHRFEESNYTMDLVLMGGDFIV